MPTLLTLRTRHRARSDKVLWVMASTRCARPARFQIGTAGSQGAGDCALDLWRPTRQAPGGRDYGPDQAKGLRASLPGLAGMAAHWPSFGAWRWFCFALVASPQLRIHDDLAGTVARVHYQRTAGRCATIGPGRVGTARSSLNVRRNPYGALSDGSTSTCSKPCSSVSIKTRKRCASGAKRRASVRRAEDAHGRHPLFDEALAEGRYRDGAARARLQSHACHEYHRCPTAPGGNEGIVALVSPFRPQSKTRRRAGSHSGALLAGEKPPGVRNDEKRPNSPKSRCIRPLPVRFHTTKTLSGHAACIGVKATASATRPASLPRAMPAKVVVNPPRSVTAGLAKEVGVADHLVLLPFGGGLGFSAGYARAKLVAPRIQFNEHVEEDGATVFEHACKLGQRRRLYVHDRFVRTL